jgi:hypothetical protein
MAVTAAGRPARARRWPAALAWALWALAMLSLGLNWWQDHLLRQSSRPDLAPLGAGVVALVLAAVSAATVGAVLASRRPRHPVGWLLLALALSGVATAAAAQYLTWGCWCVPAACRAPAWWPAPTSPSGSPRWS